MARKHTIFIGALFHVAIATFKSDSSTLHNMVPASSLEPLSCTSQLPVAAARAWQRPGTGEAQHSKDCSGCLNLHLESSSHPFHGKKLLLSPGFIFPVEARGVRTVVVSFPLCRAGLSKAPCRVTPAWVTTLQLLCLEAISKSSAILARKHLNLR